MSNNNKYICSFCGKSKKEVSTIIAGPNVYICNECVDMCYDITHKQHKVSSTNEMSVMKPEETKEQLDRYIIGQDNAKEIMSVAVYNHYKRIFNDDDSIELEKSNIMIVGPSGTGKTLIAKSIAKTIGVPFVQVDATTITESGYVGDDVESIIQSLLVESDFDIDLAQIGVIYIDEIDKKSKRNESVSSAKDVSGEGVQQALLKMIEGKKVRVSPHGTKKSAGSELVEIDTTNILFIVGGAFVGLEKIVDTRTNKNYGIGFNANILTDETENRADELLPEDIIKYGIIPEFMGRFPIVIGLNELTENELVQILSKPKNNIVSQYTKLFKMDNVDLEFTDSALQLIAKKSIINNTGARGLRSVIEKMLLKLQFNLPRLASEGLIKVIITEEFINGEDTPTMIYKD